MNRYTIEWLDYRAERICLETIGSRDMDHAIRRACRQLASGKDNARHAYGFMVRAVRPSANAAGPSAC